MDYLEQWKTMLTNGSKRGKYLDYIHDWEQKIHAFLELDPERAQTASSQEGALAGIPFAVKDNIAVAGFKLSCGSQMLKEFSSPYSATAVKKLQAAGAVVVGKTNLDEFGMGSSTDNSALSVTNNPWDLSRVPGGSSGGSAAAVAAGMVPFALGSDTGGSVRQPAGFCGVYGLKPTYGAVSRYGLVAYASSLEVVGILAADVETTKQVFDLIKGQDPLDHSSVIHTPDRLSGDIKTLGVLKGDLGLEPEVELVYQETIEKCRALGMRIQELSLPSLDYVVPSYYTIATAEASANLARFDGIRYGQRPQWAENHQELVMAARNHGFGNEVKLRILLGTYVLRSGFQDQYYLRAQKIRSAIRRDLDAVFKKADMILMPVFPVQAFKHGDQGLDSFQQKMADKFTVTANLAGIPALAIPCGIQKGLPVGMQFLAPAFAEERLFRMATLFKKEFPFTNPHIALDWSN